MNVRNVRLYGYTRCNLGDDMFIHYLVSSYPNVQFYINIEKNEHTMPFEDLNNLHIIADKNVNQIDELKGIDACVYIARFYIYGKRRIYCSYK